MIIISYFCISALVSFNSIENTPLSIGITTFIEHTKHLVSIENTTFIKHTRQTAGSSSAEAN